MTIGAAFAAVRQYYVRAPALVALMAWGLLYVVLALRRVYGGRVWLAGVRAVLLLGSYFFVGLVTVMTIVTLYIYLS